MLEARAHLTDPQQTASPSIASTAGWMSLARSGPSPSANTLITASSTQPGRWGRCRRAKVCRRGSPLARTTASFLATRANDTWISWFDRTALTSIPKPAANRLVSMLLAGPASGGTESAVKFWSSTPPDRCPLARGTMPALKRARAGEDDDVAAVLLGLQ